MFYEEIYLLYDVDVHRTSTLYSYNVYILYIYNLGAL